jgi:type II secretory pathway pseudopilin PulG
MIRNTAPQRGFTLTEVTIYVAVLAVVGLSLVSVVLASTRSASDHDILAKVEERNRTAVTRIEREFRQAMTGTAAVSNFGRTLSFRSASGFDGTSIIAGPTVSFTFELARGEIWNGLDDNGTGIADEGQLRRTDSDGATHLISSDIDLWNSWFALNGTGISITVASYGPMKDGGTFRMTKTLNVQPRN